MTNSNNARMNLEKLRTHEKLIDTNEQLFIATLGSQEGAFENVRINYSGDQGQQIKKLIQFIETH